MNKQTTLTNQTNAPALTIAALSKRQENTTAQRAAAYNKTQTIKLCSYVF
jgi:hypothetical protein